MKFVAFILLCALAVPAAQSSDQVKHDLRLHEEIICLAKNLYYEARGESRTGKYAVAEVTLNRTESKHFPSTVCDVVYQRTKHTCQFSWVCQKTRKAINRNSQEWNESYEIAGNVLLFGEKPAIIPNHKALYYHANYVDPYWKSSKRFLKRIGQHLFYTDKTKKVKKKHEI